MILSQTVELVLTSQIVSRYKKLGYDAHYDKSLTVKVSDLSPNSHVNVLCSCDTCNSEFITEYRIISHRPISLCTTCNLKRAASARIKKFGSNFLNPDTQRKIATKYKNEPFRLAQIQERRKKTKLLKYNNSTWNNQEKRKETLNRIHGTKNWNNQEKKSITCLLKYGVRHTQQVDAIFHKTCKYQICNGIACQGSYELDFVQRFYDQVQILRGPTFNYIDSFGKIRKYYSDFLIPSMNLIIEIKSSYTLLLDKHAQLKREAVLNNEYNFLWIIDKNYQYLVKLLKKLKEDANCFCRY
jgi:hypothetical protein